MKRRQVIREVDSRPDLRGTMWTKNGSPVYEFAWSLTLLEHAGGLDRLLAEWHISTDYRVAAKDIAK